MRVAFANQSKIDAYGNNSCIVFYYLCDYLVLASVILFLCL